jgi:hypothetical protein
VVSSGSKADYLTGICVAGIINLGYWYWRESGIRQTGHVMYLVLLLLGTPQGHTQLVMFLSSIPVSQSVLSYQYYIPRLHPIYHYDTGFESWKNQQVDNNTDTSSLGPDLVRD